MRLFRFALNIWITIASVLSFLLGWVALAHSPKPVQQRIQAQVVSPGVALPTLVPLQNLQVGGDGNLPNFQVQVAPPVTNNFNSAPAPVFQTSGS